MIEREGPAMVRRERRGRDHAVERLEVLAVLRRDEAARLADRLTACVKRGAQAITAARVGRRTMM